MEVRNLLHAARNVALPGRPAGVTAGLFLVVIVTQDKAEQEAGHHNVPDPQHGEVAARGAEKEGAVEGEEDRQTPTRPSI